MSFTPSAAAQAAAAAQGSNLASLATPLASLQSAINAGSLAPAAMVDALISLFGGQDNALIDTAGSGTTFTTTPTTLASASYTAPLTRKYEIAVDIAGIFGNTANYSMPFQILVDGTTASSVTAGKLVSNDTNRHGVSWRQRVSLTAGLHTIAVQASISLGTGSFDSGASMTVHVR